LKRSDIKYKCYNNIDTLPLYNYKKIIEEGEKRYLLILNDYTELPNVKENEIQALWEAIQNQLIDTFGISEKYKELLKLENQILRIRLRAAIEEDRNLLTIAEVKEMQLKKNIEAQEKTVSIDDMIIAIELRLKISINELTTTVKKFYNYLKIMTRK